MEKGKALFSDLILDPSSVSSMPVRSLQASQPSQARAIVAFSAPTSLDYSKGKNAMYFKNFHYFLDHAINCTVHSTVIVMTKVVADVYQNRIAKMNNEMCRGSQFSIRILVREDKCMDMERYVRGICESLFLFRRVFPHNISYCCRSFIPQQHMFYSMATFLRDTDTSQWDYFLYINCGMVGPKWEGDRHWTDIFISRLSDTVKLTGVTINMSFHPHVQSFMMAMDRTGIDIIKNSDAVYDCGVYNDQTMTEEERWKVIDNYEIGMSRQIINAGYEINSLVGALGDSFTIHKDNFLPIILRSQEKSPSKPVVNATEKNIWDSNTESYLLPYGDDIWNENALRSVGKGKLPAWSDFVFFKASRGILLPEIEEEVQYNNPKHTIIKDFGNVSLPGLQEPDIDVCEHAKTNFQEASKLFVIVTGYEHSGTTMLAQLIRSAPGLFGGFECGLLLNDTQLLQDRHIPFYDWLLSDMRNDLWGLNYESRDLVVHGARCAAERFSRLRQYSPLFHYYPNQNSMIVDKTPAYLSYDLLDIMDRSPGVPVIVTMRTKEKLYQSYKGRGYSDKYIETKMTRIEKNLEAAMSKYPERIYLADTTNWTKKPNMVLQGVFDFLGLEWRSEYLTMEALNFKRVPGSVVSKPFNLAKQLDSDTNTV